MKRWYLTFPEGIIKYYAESEEQIKQTFPDVVAIDPCDDPEYLYYIEQIFGYVTRTIKPNFYIVHTRFGNFIYNQFVDEKGNRLDGGKWRRVEGLRTISPFLWDLGSPKMFYDKYLADEYYEVTFADSHWTRIDYLEWAKVKKQGGFKELKVPNQFGEKFWCNSRGVVYEVDKQSSIHKKAWKDYKENPAAFAGTKPPFNPDLSKNCFRLPYIPILNQNISIHNMALIWQKRTKEEMENNIDYRVFCREGSNYPTELLEKIIKEAQNAFHN